MEQFKNYLYILFVCVILASCEKADDASGGNPLDPIDRPLSGEAIVIGVVTDVNGDPMTGVNVKCGNSISTTNYKGRFQLDDAPEGTDIVVDFELDGYMKTQKKLATKKGEERLVFATMAEIGTIKKIKNSEGGKVSDKGMSVEFPPNSFVTMDGSTFSGQAEVEISFISTSTGNFAGVFPGDFSGMREDGSRAYVQSFGFADINIFSAGEPLKLAQGKKAKLTYPVEASQQADAPATIPLWYYDYERGDWLEEGSAKLEGTEYVGEVSHFTPWNIDKPIDVCDLTGRVVDGEGNPLANAYVLCTAQNEDGWVFRAYSDENGEYKTPVQAETDIEAVAFYSAVTSNREMMMTGPEGSSNTMADLIIDLSSLEAGWEEVDVSTEMDITDIHFIDCENGWMVTSPGYRHEGQPKIKIYKTQDGGDSWSSKELQGQYKYDNANSVVRFRDKDFGVVVSMFGSYLTQDGGDTWSSLDNQSGFNAYMTDNVVFGSGNKISLLHYAGISYTTDLGQTWQSIQNDDINNKNNQLQYYYSHIVDDSNFYMFYGEYHMEVSDFTISKTTDGGTTWTSQDINNSPFSISNSSINREDTFNLSKLPAMHSLGETEHYALATNGFYSSASYLDIWSLISSDSPYMPTSLFMLDSQNGFAGNAMGGIFGTTDGGVSWSQYLTAGSGTIYDIYMCDKDSGWAVGANGTVLRYQKEPWIDNL